MKQVDFGDAKENLYRFSGGGSVGEVAPAVRTGGILCVWLLCPGCGQLAGQQGWDGVLAGDRREEGFTVATYLNPYF